MKLTTKTRKSPFIFAYLGVVMMLFSITGHALMINATTSTGTFTWSEIVKSYTLTGNGSVTVSGFSTHQLILDFMLDNTTTPSGADTTLYAFGFGIDPNASGVSFLGSSYNISGETHTGMSDAGMVTKVGSTNFTGHPIANIEVCAFSANNCSGFGKGVGIAAGTFDAFRLILDGIGTWGNEVNLNPIAVEYKAGSVLGVAATSPPAPSPPKPNPDPTPATPAPPVSVSEPNSLILLALGLIVSFFAYRRNSLQSSKFSA